MKDNDISFKIDWNKMTDFDVKNSVCKKTWITAFYNTKCKKTGIKCWSDFYKVLGVDFAALNPKDGNKVRKLRPEEIRANPITTEKIYDFIKSQYHPTKYKGRQPSALGMDYLQFSPYDDEDIEPDTIVIRIDNNIQWDAKIDYIKGELDE